MTQKINMFDVFKIKKHNKNYSHYSKGFTLLEVLMVIGILAILAGVVLVAINPARQFKIARDSQRNANISTILNAMGQNMTDHGGVFTCEGVITEVPLVKTLVSSANGDFDVARCIVPDYISVLPFDPSKEGAGYTDESDYSTGYFIQADSEGRITISADGEVSNTTLMVTR
mgnify:CR=1 FL=1